MDPKTDGLIILRGRYGDKIYIERIEPCVYEMAIGDFTSISYDAIEDGVYKGISSADPPGGPYMGAGMPAPWDASESIESFELSPSVYKDAMGNEHKEDVLTIRTRKCFHS